MQRRHARDTCVPTALRVDVQALAYPGGQGGTCPRGKKKKREGERERGRERGREGEGGGGQKRGRKVR